MRLRRTRLHPALAAAGLLLACAGLAPSEREPAPLGHLPEGARPLDYALTLAVDPQRPRFAGSARIRVELDTALRTIWMHGEDLEIGRVSATDGSGGSQRGAWSERAEPGIAAIEFESPIGPGIATLDIEYTAGFGEFGRGLYKVDASGGAYAFTQFEPLSARRAFPGFDEPRFKTPFDVTLVVPADQVAVTNTAAVAESTDTDGARRIRFAPTPPLPTYLVAWAVGPLDVGPARSLPARAGGSQPLPLRGIAARGSGAELETALARTPPLLDALERYLESPYPFSKLDVIAIPQFGPGAMENPGLIFFRDEFLLLDRENVTEGQRRAFDYVMAHELAHQWFGNLVTMRWWNDIWLNEALASWLGRRIEDEVYPANRAANAMQSAVGHAMEQDALVNARSVRQPVESTHDVYNAFDAITYDKGGGVLAMFEHWLGAEVFRVGLTHYLARHWMGTATSADLLAALSASSGRDVATPFQTFLDQSGVPLVTAERACDDDGGGVRVRQSRYLPLGSRGSTDRSWQIPVCIRFGVNESVGEVCELLTQTETRIETGSECPDWLLPNADAAGYYRFALDAAGWNALREIGWSQLSDRERRSVADNIEVGFEAGAVAPQTAFAGLPTFAQDPNPDVARAPISLLAFADEYLLPEADRASAREFGAALYRARLAALGWDAAAGESGDDKLLRQSLVGYLALDARDADVRAEADRRGRRFAGVGSEPPDTSALTPELIETALAVVVQEGGAREFDALLGRFRETDDTGMRRHLLRALASTRDPILATRARELALDPSLLPREVWTPLYTQSLDAATRSDSWSFVEAHFDALVARAGSARSAWMPWLAAGFCDAERADAVEAFLRPRIHRLEGGPRNLAASLESIRLCAALVEAERPDAVRFFRAAASERDRAVNRDPFAAR